MAQQHQKQAPHSPHQAEATPRDQATDKKRDSPVSSRNSRGQAERSDRDDGPAVQEHERVAPVTGPGKTTKSRENFDPEAGQRGGVS